MRVYPKVSGLSRERNIRLQQETLIEKQHEGFCYRCLSFHMILQRISAVNLHKILIKVYFEAHSISVDKRLKMNVLYLRRRTFVTRSPYTLLTLFADDVNSCL